MSIEGLQIHAISDTHNKHRHFTLPGGDILIHSGDATVQGKLSEALAFLDWFAEQKYSHLIFVPGNHDKIFEENPSLMADECKSRNIILLNDSAYEAYGIKIWGSPIQPWFFSWAFNRRRTIEEAEDFGGGFIKDHWDLIPEDTEILITHGPAWGILDFVPRDWGELENVGCKELLAKIYRTKVKLHVFGHIHYSAGHRYADGRTFVNASCLNESYQPSAGNPRRIVRDSIGEYFIEELIKEEKT